MSVKVLFNEDVPSLIITMYVPSETGKPLLPVRSQENTLRDNVFLRISLPVGVKIEMIDEERSIPWGVNTTDSGFTRILNDTGWSVFILFIAVVPNM